MRDVGSCQRLRPGTAAPGDGRRCLRGKRLRPRWRTAERQLLAEHRGVQSPPPGAGRTVGGRRRSPGRHGRPARGQRLRGGGVVQDPAPCSPSRGRHAAAGRPDPGGRSHHLRAGGRDPLPAQAEVHARSAGLRLPAGAQQPAHLGHRRGTEGRRVQPEPAAPPGRRSRPRGRSDRRGRSPRVRDPPRTDQRDHRDRGPAEPARGARRRGGMRPPK